ncbi:hypothetical protein Tco_0449146 [Tanacetum coccineum]
MMAEENVPAQAPTRTDEHILSRSAWLKMGKSNLLLDLQKMQKNPIFHISVDILRNTNFFIAFTVSASVPSIDRCTDISKTTRKSSKTGKHGHEKRESTKKAKDSKPKLRKVNLQSTLGQQKSTTK